jgi:hypothetical protein
MRSTAEQNGIDEEEFELIPSSGKVLGYVDSLTYSQVGSNQLGRTVSRSSGALPPSTNYETLLGEAKGIGFEIKCLGFVEGVQPTMIVVLKRDRVWEAFVGVHHRLERLVLEPRTSFYFGGGTFLSGRNQKGEAVSLLVPDDFTDDLGLTPTFNGARIRRY